MNGAGKCAVQSWNPILFLDLNTRSEYTDKNRSNTWVENILHERNIICFAWAVRARNRCDYTQSYFAPPTCSDLYGIAPRKWIGTKRIENRWRPKLIFGRNRPLLFFPSHRAQRAGIAPRSDMRVSVSALWRKRMRKTHTVQAARVVFFSLLAIE